MNIEEMVEEIRSDLGVDINSLGISEDTIRLKINESIRKISAYSPYQASEAFDISGGHVEMPEDTVSVIKILTDSSVAGSKTGRINNKYIDDTELFSLQSYFYNRNELQDPYILLMKKNELATLQNFISMDDWRYDTHTNTLYITSVPQGKVTVSYLRRYRDMSEVRDLDVVQTIKEYALALCKIIEGQIRRKLQSAPGAIQFDGGDLVSEGSSEKQRLDDWIPRHFTHLRFGIRN